MVAKNKPVTTQLQIIFKRAKESQDNQSFFIALFEYIEELINNPIFEILEQIISEKKSKDIGPLYSLEKKTLAELTSSYKNTKQYINGNAVQSNQIDIILNEIEAILDDRLTTNLEKTQTLHNYLSRLLGYLLETDKKHIDFVSKYAELNKMQQIAEWKLSKSFSDWEIKHKSLNRVQNAKAWFSFEKLLLFHNYFSSYEKIVKKSKLADGSWKLLGHVVIYREIDDILKNKQIKEDYKYFDPIEMKEHLTRVHEYALSNQFSAQTPSSYDPEIGLLTIQNQEISFTADSVRGQILKLLFEDETQRGKTHQLAQLFEDIEGLEARTKKDRMKIYSAVKGINIRVLDELSVQDFLEHDTKTVRLNLHFT